MYVYGLFLERDICGRIGLKNQKVFEAMQIIDMTLMNTVIGFNPVINKGEGNATTPPPQNVFLKKKNGNIDFFRYRIDEDMSKEPHDFLKLFFQKRASDPAGNQFLDCDSKLCFSKALE